MGRESESKARSRNVTTLFSSFQGIPRTFGSGQSKGDAEMVSAPFGSSERVVQAFRGSPTAGF